jgi:tRNA pseudouridine38-40 synthase
LLKSQTFKLYLEYDGEQFFGIQRQSVSPTVESVLISAAKKIFGNEIFLNYCGRTDRGVHSVGMPLLLSVGKSVSLDSVKIRESLNSKLSGLRVTKCFKEFSRALDIRKSAFGREYFFLFSDIEQPLFLRKIVGSVKGVVDIEFLSDLSDLVVGRFDFNNFSNNNGNEGHGSCRTVYECHVKRLNAFSEFQGFDSKVYCMSVVGQGFLYNMIRNILGAFLACDQNRFLVETLTKALEFGVSGESFYKTMKPTGLFFKTATYINY